MALRIAVMAASAPVLHHIRRFIDPCVVDAGSDATLLGRFVCGRDQEAFAALVARHGPMVYRLCRRVLGDGPAAEDVAQATFVVLARKAAGIRHPETLAAWLHGVAYRLALKARAAEARRRQVESRHVPNTPSSTADPLAEVSARELLIVLDAELQGLPERYRLPVILCCLEGRSQPEAARLLGWTPGSVKGRLERGRALLHRRLVRRGLTLSAALWTLEAARGTTTARLPAELTASVMRAVETITSSVALKTKFALVLVLMIGAFAGGAGLLASRERQRPEKATTPVANAPGSPQAAGPRTDRYGDPLPPGALARLGTVRLRPGLSARLLACLPDRKTFLSVATEDDGMAVCTWKLSTGELLRRHEKPTRLLRAVALSPDKTTLAVAGRDLGETEFRVRLWDVATAKLTGELKGVGQTWALAYTPDGKSLATAGQDNSLRLWDLATGAERRHFGDNKQKWINLAFSPDGKVLASINALGDLIQLWDTATGEVLHAFKTTGGYDRTIAFSPDGKTFAAGNPENKIIHLWDVHSGEKVRELEAQLATFALAFSPDGKILATGDARQEEKKLTSSVIRLWDLSSGRELRQLRGHVFGTNQLTFTPDGKRLLSAGGGGVIRLWDVATGEEALPFAEHVSYVNSVAYSPDGRLLATGGLDGAIRLWEPLSDKPARQLPDGHHQRVWQVAFAPDGRTLLSYGHDGSIRFWDVAAGRETRRLQIWTDARPPGSFALSPDGRTLAVWRKNGAVALLDAATGAERRLLKGGADHGGTICFSSDGRLLAALSLDRNVNNGLVQLWDVASGRELRQWTVAQPARITFSPGGRTLAMGGTDNFLPAGMTERTFHAWDTTTGQDHPFQATQPARVFSVMFSPDGRMLAWGDASGRVTLWEVAAGQVRRRMRGQHSYIESLSFSPDGKTLASASADTTVLVWDVTGRPPSVAAGPLAAQRLPALWDDLASKNAGKAFDAIGLLSTSGEPAVALLKSRLKPAPAPADPKQVARLVADLDSEQFDARQKAAEELRRLGERAEPGLRAALQNQLPLEARKRIEELLENVRAAAASPENLRNLRAVEVLEHIGTAEARDVLQALTKGASDARLTRDAKASLERLTRASR
jgi:RNA polymerase sigma factor (sigma-70 family)